MGRFVPGPIRARFEVPHSPTCVYLGGEVRDATLADAMVYAPEHLRHLGEPTTEYRDALARKRTSGTTNWQVWVCNDPDCTARALVSEYDIYRYVSGLLSQSLNPERNPADGETAPTIDHSGAPDAG